MESKISLKFLSQEDLIKAGCFDLAMAIETTENALRRFSEGMIKYPDKVSQIFDKETQNRINCLPATLLDEKVCGMKWVSVFPNNPIDFGCNNVSAVILLSEIERGFPIAFMEGTICSNLRTASVSAVAAKYLAPTKVETIGFIGAGEQAKTHFMAMKSMFPTIKTCNVSDANISSVNIFKKQLSELYPNVNFKTHASDYEEAVKDADIIITAISGQEPVLKASWIQKGCLYCHIGGWEDEYEVALKADKIVCDHWESVKHRTQTISRLYKMKKITDDNIYSDLDKIVVGCVPGRETDNEFIYFNAVGLSYVDVALAYKMYNIASSYGKGVNWVLQKQKPLSYPREYYKL